MLSRLGVIAPAAALLVIAAPTPVAAQQRSLEALRLQADDSVDLDGHVDEPFWQRADIATDFLQQDPHEGRPATENTEVRVAYDAADLYLGVLLHDSDPAGILGRERQRDAGLGSDDRFMWVLDTFLDGRTGYFFEINPAGLMGDGLLSGRLAGRPVNKAWDGIWEARVVRGPAGWSAEIRIPFRTLNFNPDNDAWGINFQRTVRRKNEESLWTGHLRTQSLFNPTHAGRLTGIRDVSQGIGLEVTPYGLGELAQAPSAGRLQTRGHGDFGADLTYSITPSLRASLTLNTDFAETEVDQRRVNLTRFPLFFPERRDFFLEGSAVYSFAPSSGPNPFFSRRIGLVAGQPVPVTWGTRLGGQAGPHDVGFMQIRTASWEGGPAEDFTVARIKRQVFEESTVGVLYTRRATGATDEMSAHTAQTFGVDLDVSTTRFRGDRNLQLEAFFVAHDDPFGTGDTSLGDRSARGVRVAYPNDTIQAHVSAREFGDAYDPAVGFVARRGFRRIQPTLGWRPRPGGDIVRRLIFEVQTMHLTDLTGRRESESFEITPFGIEMESGDRLQVDVGRTFERIDRDFRIHPDVTIPAGEYTFYGWEVRLRSASRRLVSVDLGLDGGEFWDGHRLRVRVGFDARPRPGVALGAEWERNEVRLAGGDFETNLLRLVGAWQPSPWMAFNGNVQYDDLSRVVGLFTRFRWTFRPGSDVFLVYAHNLQAPLPTERDARHSGLETLERSGAMKVAYAHRF